MKLGLNKLYSAKKIFIIPDVQGNHEKLDQLMNKIYKELSPEDHIVFCGDYIGAKSQNILTLKKLQSIKDKHENTFFIVGNHDHSFLQFLKVENRKTFIDQKSIEEELLYKGYSNASKDNIKKELKNNNITFIYEMIDYYETKDILVTHAPLEPTIVSLHKIEEGILEKMSFDIMHNFTNEENIPIRGIDKWLICGHQNNYGKRYYPNIYIESKRAFLDCFDNDLFCFIYPSKRIIKNQ